MLRAWVTAALRSMWLRLSREPGSSPWQRPGSGGGLGPRCPAGRSGLHQRGVLLSTLGACGPGLPLPKLFHRGPHDNRATASASARGPQQPEQQLPGPWGHIYVTTCLCNPRKVAGWTPLGGIPKGSWQPRRAAAFTRQALPHTPAVSGLCRCYECTRIGCQAGR